MKAVISISVFFLVLLPVAVSCSADKRVPKDVLPKGKAYTEVDTSVRVILPDYWNDYLETKVNEINEVYDSLATGTAFCFITDIHYSDNALHSPAILKYITSRSKVKKVICGGDVVVDFNSREVALGQLLSWRDSINGLDIVSLLGNHDCNTNDQPDRSQQIFKKEFFDIFCPRSDKSLCFFEGPLCGYRDENESLTRFIFLDTGAPDVEVIDSPQLKWMQERIIELPANWTVVICAHQFFNSPTSFDRNGELIQTYLDDIAGLADAEIACVVSGHCHKDLYQMSEKGYPMISTTCDSGGKQSRGDENFPYRERNTIKEQCIDVYFIDTTKRTIKIIRVGCGDGMMNREMNYYNR